MPFALLMTDILKRREASKPRARGFACNLDAIGSADRPRYVELVKRVRASIRFRSPISTGYIFRLDSQTVSLPEAAEWIAMERRCCPFLTLELSTSGAQPDWTLTLTGPKGVKALLDLEFPQP